MQADSNTTPEAKACLVKTKGLAAGQNSCEDSACASVPLTKTRLAYCAVSDIQDVKKSLQADLSVEA